jgi:16S rRNA (guanine527-N7)-methyltransferase
LGAFHVEHVDPVTARRLNEYAEAVRASPHNLLSRVGLEELSTRHIPESLRFATRLPPTDRLLDVGSGGGLPGVVIAIVRPEIEVHLLEATTKKADFLTAVATDLGLRVVVHNGRAEELARTGLAGSFEVVTARAVARLSRLVPLCAPFLAPTGRLHAIKGERWGGEVTDATSEMTRHGLVVLSSPAQHPDLDPRVVVIGRPGAAPGA